MPFPDVFARMQPSDSLVPLGRRSGRPSRATYPGAGACSVPQLRPAVCAPANARRVGALITGSPYPRNPPKERQGPPRCLDRPLRACRGRTPRRVRASPRPHCISRGGRSCLQAFLHPGHPGLHSFRGCISHGTHARVPPLRRSRYRDRRQARYRPGGLTPGRAGFAPAGRYTKFHQVTRIT